MIPHSSRARSVAISLVTVLVLAMLVAPAPAIAQSDSNSTTDDPPEELFGTEDTGLIPGTDAIRGLLAGLRERASLALGTVTGDDPSAATLADEAQTAFNDRSGDFQTYANERSTASSDYDVLAVTFEQDDSETTRYVVATVNDSDYEDVEMVTSTSRSVDEECTLRGAAARNADNEIEAFHDQFVTADTGISDQYIAKMASKYGSPVGDKSVTCTFMEG